VNPVSALYGSIARLRRAWYEGHPHRQRRLARPVISVGNLVVGGSGKTPVVACLAALLRELGERPSILSRGYGRRARKAGVLIVSDGQQMLAGVEESGDEPQMLARALPGIPVLVSSDRYEAGRLGCDQFGSTVLLLDDGYQHLRMARDLDLLVVAPGDVRERMLPAGRLREPIGAARSADALLVTGDRADAARLQESLGVSDAFLVVARYQRVRAIMGAGPIPAVAGRRAIAVAGIARPDRFFTALREQGWTVVREMTYRDHYWFTSRDRRHIEDLARGLGVDAIVTTEKDAVRLESLPDDGAAASSRARWAVLPMEMAIEPADAFATWLSGRLAAARRG
jgi:tetraacyldisaccharide 4'-kinase